MAESFQPGQALRKEFWDTDGTVHSIVATNGVIYVGGSFSRVAPMGSKLVSLDPFTGASDQVFPAIHGTAIYSIIEDGNGGWFIGGDFNLVGGMPRTNLVHILSDNTIDPVFQPHPNGIVHALALEGSTLYLGGEFSMASGQSRNRLAAWDLATHNLTPWAPHANGTVSALLTSGNVLYVGGYFTQISSQVRRNLGALDLASGAVLPWNPQGDGAVLTMGLQDEKLYVGGFFNRIGGQLRNGLAALSLDSTNALPWNPDPRGGKIRSLQVMCNTVFIGGYFTNVGGATRHRVAAVDVETGQATSWNANLDFFHSANLPSEVLALAVVGQRVYVGGQFTKAGEETQRDLAAFDAATGQLIPWTPAVSGGISVLGIAGRRVLAGTSTSLGGVPRQNLAAIDEASGKVLPFAPIADGPVLALTYSDGILYAGGNFTNVNGMAHSRLTAITALAGDVLTNWNASANNTVYALALHGTTLYVGGSFTSLNGLGRLRLGALNAYDGQLLTGWTAHADGTAYALQVLEPHLYAGGNFISIAGSTRQHLAALHLGTGAVQSWNPSANQTVYSLSAADSTIYAGGSFTLVNGHIRNHAAGFDPNSGEVMGWNPNLDDEVRAIKIADDRVFLAGIFQHAGSASRLGLAAVQAETGSLLEWNSASSPANRMYALALSEKGLYAGGEHPLEFQGALGNRALAAFPPEGFPVLVQQPFNVETAPGKMFTLSVDAEGESPLSFRWTFNGTPLPNTAATFSAIAQAGGSGVYEVSVSNRLGVTSARAILTVLEPVSILSQPLSQTASNGTDVILSVAATGNPAPLYQWRLNGANIPGAVFPTLILSNVSATSGGSYYAVVGNQLGAINSSVAELKITNPALPFHDNFQSRGSITAGNGTGVGLNTSASAEVGEPSHAGKVGGKSMWLSWTAPGNGTATFSTRGSAFDTLLAIYTGTSLSNLATVVADEDRGGFFTSQVEFNAQAGVEYIIAVDGLAGARGSIVLHWNLDPFTLEIPRIIAQPVSQSVPPGGQATFEVVASSVSPLSYQWFFGCREIRDATNATLTVANVALRHVGRYQVFVYNQSTRMAQSLPAALEISTTPGVVSADKFEDLLETNSPGTNNFGPSPKASLASGASALLVSMGTISFQTFDTSFATSSLRETNHCGIIGGYSAGIRFQPTEDGTVLVDTIGSPFNTVLAIYRNTNFLVLATNPAAAFVLCDDDGAPDKIRSRLQFKAKANERYFAVVDGVLGAEGIATIHWQLGKPPTILQSASNLTASFGDTVTLTSGTSSSTLITAYQWFCNGMEIMGATNSTLTITNLRPFQAGVYSVIASNYAGQVLNDAAHLQVNVPLHLDPRVWMENGQFQATVWANSNQSFVLESSTDLQAWLPLLTNTVRTNPLPVWDTKTSQFPRRFYRVRPHP